MNYLETTVRGWLPPGLNGKRGLIRMHYHSRAVEMRACSALLLEWRMHLLNQSPLPLPFPVTIHYTRIGLQIMDWDNAGASFKLIGDALVHLGVLTDDSPKHITELQIAQEKAHTRAEQGFRLLLTPRPKVAVQ